MIPYALLNCIIDGTEVRIVDLSVFHFLFRVPQSKSSIKSIHLSFYNGKGYDEMELSSFSFSLEEETEFAYTYRIDIEEEEYAHQVRLLMKLVQDYTHWKEMDLQEKSIDYPLSLDSIYPKSKENLLHSMFSSLEVNETSIHILNQFEFGLCLDNLILYQRFLEMDWLSFLSWYFEKAGLHRHPIKEVPYSYVYIGNSFCAHLFPNLNVLKKILDKCKILGLIPVILFSPMKEHEIEQRKEIIRMLESDLEIVVNDLGLLELCTDRKVTLGVLLNKYIKDTRISYMKNVDLDSLRQNGWNLNVEYKLSYESNGYLMEYVANSDYYFPKFQMNTASFCTMYAKCHNGNRAYQQDVLECPMYCLSNHFLYPSHLKMVGEYNSLFGYDTRILQDANYLEEIFKFGIRRMIVSV